jgi:hypothetical protein
VFELKPAGTLTQMGIGASDRPEESPDTWEFDDDSLVFHTPSNSSAIQAHKILTLPQSKLVLEK